MSMAERDDLSLGSVLRRIADYKAYVLAVVLALVIGLLMPGGGDSVIDTFGARDDNGGQTTGVSTGTDATGAVGDGSGGATGASGTGSAGVTGGRAAAGPGATSGGRAAAVPPALVGRSGDPLAAPDCDRASGRIRFPSKFAPPCVGAFSGSNGGATHRGVSADKIVVVSRFSNESNPAVSATLTAAGASDTREDVRATTKAWMELFEAHYQTYGRKVELVYMQSSGSDDEAQRADAVRVATEFKAFAAWGGGSAYADELTRRGVVCMCGGRDAKYFLDRAPFLWGIQPSYEQWLWPAAEYIGKRLWNRNARWAGDALYTQQKRKFAILYEDDPDDPVAVGGVKSFEAELAKYGAQVAEKVAYESDIDTAQEQARVIIARLQDAGITSVVFWGDPLAPIFFTKEATSQNYHPEWIMTGGNLVDTSFFGRTYDPVQWQHAFGVSQLWARGPQAENEVFHLHQWHHGRAPQARATYEIIFQTPWAFYTGIHLAGPNLNPGTFRDGLWSFPPSGGGPTLVKRSFGRHGLWPFDDYTSFDDVTEIWWDPNAVGENEIGQQGKGLWAYVAGGKRYSYGTWPTSEPSVFNPQGAVTKYDRVPPEDQYPNYEHKHYHG